MNVSQAAPAAEPASASQLKDFLRVSDSTQDTYIDALIVRARRAVERFTGRALINRTITLDLDSFEVSSDIWLPYPPGSTVTSVTVYADDGTARTVSTDNYYTLGSDPLRIALDPTGSGWVDSSGQGYERSYKAMQIVYTAGYGAAASAVPEDLVQAVLEWAKSRFTAGTAAENVVNTAQHKIIEPWMQLSEPYCYGKFSTLY